MHFNNSEIASLVLIADGGILEVVSEVADRRYVKELVVVGERDPEGAVIRIFVVDLALGEFSPLGCAISPITFPFFLSPRVANLQYTFGLCIIKFDYFCSD